MLLRLRHHLQSRVIHFIHSERITFVEFEQRHTFLFHKRRFALASQYPIDPSESSQEAEDLYTILHFYLLSEHFWELLFQVLYHDFTR